MSTCINCTNGVKQGGVLSPKFFILYMNELSNALNDSDVGCKILNVRCNHLGYADDFSLNANSVYSLQKLLNVCASFSLRCAVTFNQRKTKCMYFANKRVRGQLAIVHLYYVNIKHVHT